VKLLLDTHALLWAVDDPSKLGVSAATALQHRSNDLHISAAVLWEISIKVAIGKLRLGPSFDIWANSAIAGLDARLLPISIEHANRQIALPWHHRDPFDRLLVAQGLSEGMTIVSKDPQFDAYAAPRIWN